MGSGVNPGPKRRPAQVLNPAPVTIVTHPIMRRSGLGWRRRRGRSGKISEPKVRNWVAKSPQGGGEVLCIGAHFFPQDDLLLTTVPYSLGESRP